MFQKRTSVRIFRDVLFSLVLRELKARVGLDRLGFLGMFISPAIQMIGTMVIFTFLRARTIPGVDFPVFLLNGIVPYILFKNIALKGMEAVNANRALFAYKQIQPLDCILARAVVESFLMIVIYAIFLFALGFWMDFDVAIHHPLQWAYYMMCGAVFCVGLAMLLSVLVQKVPESKLVIRITFLPLYFMTGILTPIWHLPQSVQQFMAYNPFYHIIDMLRRSVFEFYPHADTVNPGVPPTVALVTLAAGLLIYRYDRRSLAQA